MIIQYSELICAFQKSFFSGDFVSRCCDIIKYKFLSDEYRQEDLKPRQHLTILYFLTTLICLYSTNPTESSDIRDYLLNNTNLILHILMPYIKHCVYFSPALSNIPAAQSFIEDPILLQGIIMALKLLCILTFRIPQKHRMNLLIHNFTCQLLKVTKFFKAHGGVLSLVFFFNGNIDSLNPPKTDLPDNAMPHNILASFVDILKTLNNDEISFITVLLERSGDIPVSRDTLTYSLLWRQLDETSSKVKNIMLDSPIDREDDDMSPEEFQKQAKQMKKDRQKTIEEAKLSNDDKIQEESKIKESKYNDTKLPNDSKIIENKSLSLLGDLPKLGERGQNVLQLPPTHKKKKNKKNPKINTIQPSDRDINVPSDVPIQFLCAINGHIMKRPMKSPTGYIYEYDTITEWIKNNGEFCPITGKPLKLSDLVVDKELSDEITKWQIQKQMNIKFNPTKESDLYDF